jgi:hypothetical protein
VGGELIYGFAFALVPPLGPKHYVGWQRARLHGPTCLNALARFDSLEAADSGKRL